MHISNPFNSIMTEESLNTMFESFVPPEPLEVDINDFPDLVPDPVATNNGPIERHNCFTCDEELIESVINEPTQGQPYIGDNDADGDGYDDDGGYLTYDSPYKYASNYRKVDDIVKEQQQFYDAKKKEEKCQVPITSNEGHVLCKEDMRL